MNLTDDQVRRVRTAVDRVSPPPPPKKKTDWPKLIGRFIGSIAGDFVGAAVIMGCLGFLHESEHVIPALGYWFCWISLIALSSLYHCVTYKAEKDAEK